MAEVDGDVDTGKQLPQPLLVDPPFPHEPSLVEPEALEPAVEVESRRRGADEEQDRLRVLLANLCERAQELGDPLARVHDAEAPEHGA